MKIIVVGAGKVGYNISRVLSEDHDIVVVDKDPVALQSVYDNLDVMGVEGNGAVLECSSRWVSMTQIWSSQSLTTMN